MDNSSLRTHGSGPHTVLYLHGWFGSARTGWGTEFVDTLDGDACTHVFLDHRGYGQRQDEAGEFTLDEIARDALAAADSLGARKFSVVGHSMGGAAAQRVLSLAPNRVSALIGISPVPASPTPLDADGEALFGGAAQDDENRATIIDVTTGNRLSRRWIDAVVATSRAESTEEAFGAHFRSWVSADFADEVPADAARSMAIVGAHDPALGEQTIRATWCELMPASEVVALPDAGHYAMNEAPIRTATEVNRFLAG